MRGGGILDGVRRELGAAFAFAAGLTVFVNLASLVVPLYDMQLYDRILLSRNMDSLTALSLFCVAGMVLYAVLEFLRSSLFLVMGDRLARRLDMATLKAALARSLDGDPGAAAQALRDLNDLRAFVIGSAVAVPLDLLWSPALLAVLVMLHPLYGAYAAGCVLVLVGLSLANDRATRADLAEANAAANRSLAALAGTLRNGELLDGLGMLPGLARRWGREQGRQQAQLDRAAARATAYTALSRACRLLMQGGIIALGVVLVVRHQATPGSMMGANLLVAKLLQPFELLVAGWRQWVVHAAAWKRVSAVLREDGLRRADAAWGCASGRLVVERLGFSVDGRRILDDVSFTVEPGQAIAITGPSAAGKTTLVRLILGLGSPTTGDVTLDGRPTARWQREDFGRHVGYLPQAVSLLDGTIFDNIARMDAADAELVIDAARRAGVHEMIGRLPLGYDTWVGGDSYALSGGQRQRIALARALFGRPRLLVLDEPNANLDHLGDDALAEAIAAAKRDGAAVVIVTHRPAILEVADTLLVLGQGRVERLTARDAPLTLALETA